MNLGRRTLPLPKGERPDKRVQPVAAPQPDIGANPVMQARQLGAHLEKIAARLTRRTLAHNH
jgi:hypothetical protein